jgi:hypothetical protein
VAQNTSLEVAAATVRIDDVAADIAVFDRLRHRVDREVTPREVFLERDVRREARGEAVVAGTGLAFGPGERVLVAGLRMQEDGKVLADGTVTEREQVVGLGADDHVVAFGKGPSEQRVPHGAAHQVRFHCRIVAEFVSGRRCPGRNPNPIPTPGKAGTGVGIGFGSRPDVTRLASFRARRGYLPRRVTSGGDSVPFPERVSAFPSSGKGTESPP